jgi:hypothetical protein
MAKVKEEEKIYAKEFPEFITVTCLDWKSLLEDDVHKDIIMNSLRFRVVSISGRPQILERKILQDERNQLGIFNTLCG